MALTLVASMALPVAGLLVTPRLPKPTAQLMRLAVAPPRSSVTMQYGGTAWQIASQGYTVYTVNPGADQVLGRYDMAQQKITVSRAQCQVQVGADGTATLYSTGKPVTGFRAQGQYQWEWLNKGEARYVTEGAQVSLDQYEPEGSVFTFQSGQAQQGGYGQQQQQPGGYGQQYVQAYYDMQGDPAQGQLSFRAGDTIQVTQAGEPEGWWEGSLNGQVGWFPSTFCSAPYS